jgi:hypothetical protein
MTREAAWKAIKKLVGSKALARVEVGISSPERRDAARELRLAYKQEREVLAERLKVRTAEILSQHPEIAEMREEVAMLRKREDQASADALYYKFNVSTDAGWCSIHQAHGDTWEEVIAALKAKGSHR